MKVIITPVLFLLCIYSYAYAQDCIDGINKLPMYGHVKKCKKQLADDAKFLAECDAFGPRKDVAKHMADRGWQYFYKGELDTATMRFNQAWLLDSLNAKVYWGVASILGRQQKFNESIPLFNRALQLSPDDANLWYDESVSYGNIFMATRNYKYLDLIISDLKHAIHLSPQNPDFYGQLANAYGYFSRRDSVVKYVHIAEKMGATNIDPTIKRIFGK